MIPNLKKDAPKYNFQGPVRKNRLQDFDEREYCEKSVTSSTAFGELRSVNCTDSDMLGVILMTMNELLYSALFAMSTAPYLSESSRYAKNQPMTEEIIQQRLQKISRTPKLEQIANCLILGRDGCCACFEVCTSKMFCTAFAPLPSSQASLVPGIVWS